MKLEKYELDKFYCLIICAIISIYFSALTPTNRKDIPIKSKEHLEPKRKLEKAQVIKIPCSMKNNVGKKAIVLLFPIQSISFCFFRTNTH